MTDVEQFAQPDAASWLERMRAKKKQIEQTGSDEPVAKQRRLQNTHIDVEQPSTARANELLGVRPPSTTPPASASASINSAVAAADASNLLEAARRERETLQKRIERAKLREKNVFYNPSQVKQRYGKRNQLSDFIREKATRTMQSTAHAGTRGSENDNIDTSLRIDEMVTSQENVAAARDLAAAKVFAVEPTLSFTQTGTKPSLGIDEFVSRLAQAAGDIEDGLFVRPFHVVGLSTTEPNPEWEEMKIDRQALLARRKELVEERRSLTSGRKWIGLEDSNAHGSLESVRRNEMRRRLVEYEPLESIELLKPNSQVRQLNLRWRTMLGSVLASEHARYLESTRAYLARTAAAVNGTVDGLTDLYMQRVVNPVFDRYLEQLRSATYEDQPLTREVLEEYLYDFLNYLFATPRLWLQDPPLATGDVPRRSAQPTEYERALHQRSRELRSLMGLPPVQKVNVNEDDAEKDAYTSKEVGSEPALVAELPRAAPDEPEVIEHLTSDEEERAQVAEYLRQALNIHASPVYLDWLRLWMAQARKEAAAQPDDVVNARDSEKLDMIDRLVRNMVKEREDVQKRRMLHVGRTIPRYQPITEAEIRESYATLLQNEVARFRADQLVRQKEEWERVFTEYLSERSNSLPSIELRVFPRIDLLPLLTSASDMTRRQAQQLFANDAETRARVEQMIDQRTLELATEVAYYAPRIPGYAYVEHAPLDVASNPTEGAIDSAWSPYTLPYPLSLVQTELQLPGLRSNVLTRNEQFDAEGTHRRANDLRSILSYDYAERLVLRSIAEINFYLEKVMVPERQVAFTKDIFVETNHPIRLSATIELRPELEMARRLPRATRDERVDVIVDTLRSTSHRVRWYFIPSYGAAAGVERLAYSETLPPGVYTSVLMLDPTGQIVRIDPNNNTPTFENRETTIEEYRAGNEAIGGIYRVEFDTSALEPPYKSLFKATIRVMARCRRDGVIYEVGPHRSHGECQWREYAHDEKMQNVIDEWRVLVTRGKDAFDALIRRRREEQTLRDATGKDYDLFLPPWGEESEQGLLRTFRSTQSDTCFEERFTYSSIIQRIIDRLGGQMRRDLQRKLKQLDEMTPMDEDDRVQIEELRTGFQRLASDAENTNMALFSILVGGSGATEPLIQTAFMSAAAQSALGTWAPPERDAELANDVDAGIIDRVIEYYGYLVSGVTPDGPAVRVPLFQIENTYAPPLIESPTLPVERVKPLMAGFSGSLERVPLATILNAMYLPTIWPNLTWREKRFINTMVARFTRFAREFRLVERRRLYYSGLLRNDKSLDFAPTLLSAEVGIKTIYNRPPAETPMFVEVEAEIDEKLGSMTPQAVQQSTAWYTAQQQRDLPQQHTDADFEVGTVYESRENFVETMLLDTDLCREYHEKVRDLARSGLIVPNVAAANHFVSTRHNPHLPTAWKVTALQMQGAYTADDLTTDLTHLTSHRPDWLGSHTYTTQQPDFYQVIVDPERGAAVRMRGSTPLNKGYDFEGLNSVIVETTRQYTRIAQGEEESLTPLLRLNALDRLETRLQRLELTYNFLAFISPPLSNNVFLPVAAILLFVDDMASAEWLKRLRDTLY